MCRVAAPRASRVRHLQELSAFASLEHTIGCYHLQGLGFRVCGFRDLGFRFRVLGFGDLGFRGYFKRPGIQVFAGPRDSGACYMDSSMIPVQGGTVLEVKARGFSLEHSVFWRRSRGPKRWSPQIARRSALFLSLGRISLCIYEEYIQNGIFQKHQKSLLSKRRRELHTNRTARTRRSDLFLKPAHALNFNLSITLS